jgi:hypothetical protein
MIPRRTRLALIWDLAAHAIWPALELHGLTPLALVSAMTFGNITMSFTLGMRVVSSHTTDVDSIMRDIVPLWAMASLSILIWLVCVVSLRDVGLN